MPTAEADTTSTAYQPPTTDLEGTLEMSSNITQRQSALETYGVLGAILAQAAALPGWNESAPFLNAHLSWDGSITVAVSGEAIGTALAKRLDLGDIHLSTQQQIANYAGTAGTSVQNLTVWEGSYARHEVTVHASWITPLGDLDLAEGEEALQARDRQVPADVAQIITPPPRPTRQIPETTGERSVRFEARFASTCLACEEPIEAGSDVAWSDGEVVHDSCAIATGVEVFDR